MTDEEADTYVQERARLYDRLDARTRDWWYASERYFSDETVRAAWDRFRDAPKAKESRRNP